MNEAKNEAIEDLEQVDKEANIQNQTKRKRKAFPTTAYEDSLEIANAIWKYASGQKVRRITLFDSLDKSPDSGPSRALVTASSKYKITTGSYTAEFIEFTQDGAIATDPEGDPIQKLEATFKLVIQNNEFFLKLYEAYKEIRLPATSVMADLLAENGLPREDCEECVEIFIVNCKFIGAIKVIAGSERILSLEFMKEELFKKIGKPIAKSSNNSNSDASDLPFTHETTSDEPTNHINEDMWEKTCFFIAPIGDDQSEERKHSDLFLGQIVEPVLLQFGFKVIRADGISSAGIITSQIIEHIIKSKIVVADLSFHNPNVFYELSLRHTQKKPTIHIIRKCDKIPFDITSFRTITIDDSSIYTLLPQLESYKAQISSQVRKLLEEPEEVENPISAYLNASKRKNN